MDRPDRAVAVVTRGAEVLVMLRHRDGRAYAVLPGGGIEPGETPEDAVLRELTEETGLTGRVEGQLWTRDDDGRRATYLRISGVVGEPLLGGPELAKVSTTNTYEPRWAGMDELDDLDLQPAAVRALLTPLVRPVPPA